jgi:hypothetical protein
MGSNKKYCADCLYCKTFKDADVLIIKCAKDHWADKNGKKVTRTYRETFRGKLRRKCDDYTSMLEGSEK